MAPSVLPGGGYDDAPSSGPAPPAPAAFAVSPDEVLAKRAALLAEAQDFQRFLADIREDLVMQPYGGDPVSQDVARAVTYRLVGPENGSYWNVCQQWVDNLFRVAEALGETARQYGYTDEDIAASFHGSGQGA